MEPSAPMTPPINPVSVKPRRSRKRNLVISILVILLVAGVALWISQKNSDDTGSANSTRETSKVEGLQLDPNKDYGNKYADGILPVGDGKYTSTGAEKGKVYTCETYAQNLANTTNAGAETRGPWFTNNNTEYDINKKAKVSGNVMWQASLSNTVNGDTRTIVTNDLPDHPTGVFPIMSTDAAYTYDRNPNTISAQNLTYSLSANPTYGSPACMGGQVGVMLTGVAIFNGFDAGGRDAGAWEVQDNCSGHPEKQGEYHYHTLSSCIKDISVSTVIGYALDGFPITGPQVGHNNILTTDDLDECHGIVSSVTIDKKTKTTYHYVMTQDFPYSASCFRGQAADIPGMQGGPQGRP